MQQGQSNSEPSMEDILASIRKIIAEEPQPQSNGRASSAATAAAPIARPLPADTSRLAPRSAPPTPAPAAPTPAHSQAASAVRAQRGPSALERDLADLLNETSVEPAAPAPDSHGHGDARLDTADPILPGLEEARRAIASDTSSQAESLAVLRNTQQARKEPTFAVPSPSIAAALPRASSPSPLTPADTSARPGSSKQSGEGRSTEAKAGSANSRNPASEHDDDPVQKLLGRLAGSTLAAAEAAATVAPATERRSPSTPAEIERRAAANASEASGGTPSKGGTPPPAAGSSPAPATPAPVSRSAAASPAASAATLHTTAAAPQAATAAARALAPSAQPSLPASIAPAVTAAAAAALASVGAIPKPITAPQSGSGAGAPGAGTIESKALAPPVTGQRVDAEPARGELETTKPKPGAVSGDAADAKNPATFDRNSAVGSPGSAADMPSASDPQMLEDILADLLRPMVRKWLDENMTRALEKAVRIEVADGVLDVVSKMNATTKG